MFSPVSYLTEAQAAQVFDEVLENIRNGGEVLQHINPEGARSMVYAMLLAAATCLKHEGFREEQEWRAIYTPRLKFSPLIELSTETVSGVPQPIYKIPLDETVSPNVAGLDFKRIFDRLIIGPTAYPVVMGRAFGDELQKAGIMDAHQRVFASGIPIRS